MRRALRTAFAAAVCAAALPAAAAGWTVPGFAPVEAAVPSSQDVPAVYVAARFDAPDRVAVVVSVPPGCALLRDAFAVHAPGVAAEPSFPEPDAAASGHAGAPAFAGDLSIPVSFDAPLPAGAELSVTYQVCGELACYAPETVRFPVPDGVGGIAAAASDEPVAESALDALKKLGYHDLRVVRTLPHAADKETFLRFVRGTGGGDATAASEPPRNRLLYLLTLLLGGFLLNLTPCVLPLVPVNLALLGAGAGRRSRRSGFALGCAFGLGISLAYGALGLFSAATGRAFGFLHSHVAFHVAFAVLFCVLALAMLDAVRIDFSSLRNLLPRRRRAAAAKPAAAAGTFPALFRAFAAGAGSALLAGACVAPALVGALLVSAELLRRGDAFGALVPFALGLGMALPWPLLGAGLAVLPKPGAWMNRVKQLFAVLFLAAAVHFLLQAFRIAVPTAPADPDWISNPAAAAVAAEATGRPVLLSLTADWCAACRAMESGVLEDPEVREALAATIRLRIDCTDVDSPAVRATMRAVGARGLPFFAVLE